MPEAIGPKGVVVDMASVQQGNDTSEECHVVHAPRDPIQLDAAEVLFGQKGNDLIRFRMLGHVVPRFAIDHAELFDHVKCEWFCVGDQMTVFGDVYWVMNAFAGSGEIEVILNGVGVIGFEVNMNRPRVATVEDGYCTSRHLHQHVELLL